MNELELKTAVVDLAFLKVTRTDDDGVHALTETEGALLRFFVDNANRDIERSELLSALGRSALSTRAIDIAVARLRAKLGEPKVPNHIRTVRGVGYRFVGGADAPSVVPVAQVSRPAVPIATGRIDLDRRLFLPTGGEPRTLGKLDGDLLERLSTGAAVPRDRLIREIWGRGRHDRSLTAALRRLRTKLGDDLGNPRIVVSLPGSAVRLERVGDDAWETRTNLRPQRTTFVDRPEVDRLVAMLDGPLTTIKGPAGIGKTRLAYEVGLQQLRDEPNIEVWFCDLSCALGEQGIVRAVETSLGIHDGPVSTTVSRITLKDESPISDTTARILRVLARKPKGSIIILDNFDQVSHHAAPLEAWLVKASNVRFIATSRHALGLPNERCLDVGPLEVDAAANLFADRAVSAREIDARSAPVRTLVQHLDCLPLAIELAAARATEFSAEDLLDRLNDRLNWLVRPPAGSVSPHRSLRGALDWSWDLLNDDARTALAECAVFARGFTTDLARGVLSVPAVGSTLAHLADRSLLHREAHGWRMYEGIREYAREKALLMGLWSRTSERHAEMCVRRATIAAGKLQGRTLIPALAELRQLRDELLAIHARSSQPMLQIRAAVVLCPLIETEGPRELMISLCREALQHDPPPESAWRLWMALGYVARTSARYPQSEEYLRKALVVASEVGEHPRAIVACELAFTLYDSGSHVEAEPMLHEVLDVFREVGDWAREADARRYIAKLAARTGEPGAIDQLERVCKVVEDAGDPLRAYYLHRDLMLCHLSRWDLDRAAAAIGDAITWARVLKVRRSEYDALRWLAHICRHRGDYPGAIRMLTEALEGYEALGEDAQAQLMRRYLALVMLEGGELEAAEQAFVQACAEPEEDNIHRTIDLANLAIVWHLQGRLDAAIHSWQRLLDRLGPNSPFRGPIMGHLAAAFADDDRVEEAVEHLAQAKRLAPEGPSTFLDLCNAVVDLGRARAGDVAVPTALSRARGVVRAITTVRPGEGLSVAQRDQDVNIFRQIVERAIASVEQGIAAPRLVAGS